MVKNEEAMREMEWQVSKYSLIYHKEVNEIKAKHGDKGIAILVDMFVDNIIAYKGNTSDQICFKQTLDDYKIKYL